ncbi:MAG: ABC transporter permease subunit [Paracoccaceae bacterium]
MPGNRLVDHAILLAGVIVMTGPLCWLVWQLISGLDPSALWSLFVEIWRGGRSGTGLGAGAMMLNSLILALGVAVIKCAISLLAAYALVYFRVPRGGLLFGVILLPMFFPIETRILPTFAVTNHLGLLNTYTGMILPITASGLGVLVFRQYLRQIPPELTEAARIDGAGPLRILFDIILPLSAPMMAALFAILFVLGWNQYVWPIMITTTSQDHDTLVRGMAYAGFGGQAGMVLALLSLLPPAVVVIALQRWLMRGLTAGIH